MENVWKTLHRRCYVLLLSTILLASSTYYSKDIDTSDIFYSTHQIYHDGHQAISLSSLKTILEKENLFHQRNFSLLPYQWSNFSASSSLSGHSLLPNSIVGATLFFKKLLYVSMRSQAPPSADKLF